MDAFNTFMSEIKGNLRLAIIIALIILIILQALLLPASLDAATSIGLFVLGVWYNKAKATT